MSRTFSMFHTVPHRCGLDVFEDEPAMKPGLEQCPNAVIVPHIASASMWTRSGMVSLGENLELFEECKELSFPPRRIRLNLHLMRHGEHARMFVQCV